MQIAQIIILSDGELIEENQTLYLPIKSMTTTDQYFFIFVEGVLILNEEWANLSKMKLVIERKPKELSHGFVLFYDAIKKKEGIGSKCVKAIPVCVNFLDNFPTKFKSGN